MKKKRIDLFDTVNSILLLIITIACVFPFLHIFFLSISDGRFVANGDVVFIPKGIHFESYKFIFKTPTLSIGSGLFNSFIYTVFGTILSLVVTFMTAYVLSRRQLKGRFIILSVFVFTWVFEAGIIPYYIVLSKMSFVNNPLVMIIPFAINTQYLLIAKAFMDALPDELEEAAVVDGANDFKIMWKIYMPISGPIIATVAMFYAVFIWNQYLTPLLYLRDEKLQTIQQVIKRLVISSGDTVTLFRTVIVDGHMVTPATLSSSAIFVAMIPIVCVYPFVQKYFKKGILLGSVKG